MDSVKLKQTPLFLDHKNLGGKIVPFAGYEMPVQYTQGVIFEHLNVRRHAGLFDVSHMGVAQMKGPKVKEFLNFCLTRDLSKISASEAAYSLLCRESGGTVDDLIVYCVSNEHFYLVLNASNKEKDVGYFRELQKRETKFSDIRIDDAFDKFGLLALQGPSSPKILTNSGLKLNSWPKPFSFIPTATLFGIPVSIAFTGYTGETGCEIFCPSSQLSKLWNELLKVGKSENLCPIGLAARDTLRTEMGYSLYGHELEEDINPVEAGLSWAVGFNKESFVGIEALRQAKENPARRLVCFRKKDSKQAPRPGMDILVDGKACGKVGSGTLGPSLGYSIGMGLVDSKSFSKIQETKNLQIDIRGSLVNFEVCKRPFFTKGI